MSPLGEFLGADGGYDIGASDGMSGEKFYGNIEVYPLGYSLSTEDVTDGLSYDGFSGGIGDGKLEES